MAKAITKAQLTSELSTKTGLTKAQVRDVFTALVEVVAGELKGGRPVTVPGLTKIAVQHKAATPARPGKSPFTGEAITIKAKPARKVVKVKAVKALKDLV